MATYDELFGKGASASSTGAWVKPGVVGETLIMVQVGEIKRVPQQIEVDGQKRDKWLVQVNEGDRYKPMGKGTFDPDAVKNAFEPDYGIHLKVRVVARKNPDTTLDDTFKEHEATWDLSAGDQMDKLKDAMLDSGVALVDGTRFGRKFLADNPKPYKYSIKMQAGE